MAKSISSATARSTSALPEAPSTPLMIDVFWPSEAPSTPLTNTLNHNAGRQPLATSPSTQLNVNPGNTFSSFMDPPGRSTYSEKEQNSQEAIYNLIQTEVGFVDIY
ncbi:hypothetical protein PTTG_03389 [Puccinia triticina 1-1 BBBD Race 1]|uniref:Uncharacterized protein n=1 Tax=Puccinia triticina (isolate 1-1 / race 1 (BBBD)) TaxID=630390 RepID=A0A0C4ERH0_PUCT1|nr:hypothetical protein PTTG_03389 [Puccinia triticina 1-1 BBBD Race 1]